MGYKGNDRCLDKVGGDEPIFVLRAQDATMIRTIRFWLSINHQISPEKRAEAEAHIEAVHGWQEGHDGQVKAAD
jgi:hypothetical protein